MDGEEDESAPVGSRLFISEALYETDDGTTRGDEVGRTHIECTAQVYDFTFACDIAFVFDSGSQLHGSVVVDFSTQSETEALQFDIAVTGGTGDYSRAKGVVNLLDISEDPEAETETLYEAHRG
ncbi:Dirigent-like protein [Modestobacter sp. DSM 44400]|uniref:dirigent protein n=1 Tax=Modestobacter sp. DSM 44400 TaxID=1550230 RepID=UPI00089622D5|nr:dirigent protein [Modestobacter sp. DSM 44400]SDY51213.1 Dirigent-like protein [Modestobacter sp. DSM 44400]